MGLEIEDQLEGLLGQKSWDIYSEQSQFTHDRHRTISVPIAPGLGQLRVGGDYDRDMSLASCCPFVPIALGMMESLALLLLEEKQQWADAMTPIMQDAQRRMIQLEAPTEQAHQP